MSLLIVLSVAVIALLIAVLAIYLFATGALLKRIADNLDDCLGSVKKISVHASAIGPGVMRINRTGKDLAGAMPLLYGGAEQLVAKVTATPAVPGVGYMDVDSSAVGPDGSSAVPAGVGYLDR